MTTMASRITSLTVVYSTVYSDADQMWTGEFSTQRASYAEDVSIWWRHHGMPRKGQQRLHIFKSTAITHIRASVYNQFNFIHPHTTHYPDNQMTMSHNQMWNNAITWHVITLQDMHITNFQACIKWLWNHRNTVCLKCVFNKIFRFSKTRWNYGVKAINFNCFDNVCVDYTGKMSYVMYGLSNVTDRTLLSCMWWIKMCDFIHQFNSSFGHTDINIQIMMNTLR